MNSPTKNQSSRSTFRTIKYMNGSIFSKASNMNGVGFEVLARTPVPHLPPIYHTFPLPSPSASPTRFFVCRFTKNLKSIPFKILSDGVEEGARRGCVGRVSALHCPVCPSLSYSIFLPTVSQLYACVSLPVY